MLERGEWGTCCALADKNDLRLDLRGKGRVVVTPPDSNLPAPSRGVRLPTPMTTTVSNSASELEHLILFQSFVPVV